MMHVGAMRVRLLVRQAQTLKDKRQVVRSILDRLKNSFNIAAAEVASRDDPKSIVLGFTAVGEEAIAVKTILEQVGNALRVHPVAEFVAAETTDFSCEF
jgi:uncharacterized protein YlxP (DUF503 family)